MLVVGKIGDDRAVLLRNDVDVETVGRNASNLVFESQFQRQAGIVGRSTSAPVRLQFVVGTTAAFEAPSSVQAQLAAFVPLLALVDIYDHQNWICFKIKVDHKDTAKLMTFSYSSANYLLLRGR